MNNPVTEVLALGRVPAAVTGDIRAIADAAPLVTVIQPTLKSVLSELKLTNGETARVRGVVEPQQEKVARIEQMVVAMDQRTAVMEQTLLDLTKQIDTATELLPNPARCSRWRTVLPLLAGIGAVPAWRAKCPSVGNR